MSNKPSDKIGPIGIFNSGYGGLTILKEIQKKLPHYDYIYLGDNARAPYGTRSFETVYNYTLECVKELFAKGCHLVIIACNTASAKALRNIQQLDLPKIAPDKRVLGVIRPTTELVGKYTKTNHVGILGTSGTVNSESYPLEIHKSFPKIKVFQEACPIWVNIVENNEIETEGADFFIQKNLRSLFAKSNKIDTIILGCTHYPLLMNKIKKYLPANVTVLSQGEIVAAGLEDYLKRHPEMEKKCSKNKQLEFYTTETPALFDKVGSNFFEATIRSKHLQI